MSTNVPSSIGVPVPPSQDPLSLQSSIPSPAAAAAVPLSLPLTHAPPKQQIIIEPPTEIRHETKQGGGENTHTATHLHVTTNSSPRNDRSAPPSPSPPPPPPPLFLSSSNGCNRIADYFLVGQQNTRIIYVLGRVNDADTPLVPMRKLSRSNSQTIQPISDLIVVSSDKLKDVPYDYTRLTDFSSKDVDVNPGLLKTPVFLAECRVPRRRGSAVVMPLTGIDVIAIDKKEPLRDGFTQLPGNLNPRSIRSNISLCVERDAHKSPLIDIKIVHVPGGVKALAEAHKWYHSHPPTSTSQADPHKPITFPTHITNPFTSIIPNDYTRIDHPVNASKDLFLCYKTAKRRAVEYMSYEPFLVDRYPEVDRPDFPLETQGVSMLCFPRGMLLKTELVLPSFMTFVLTQANGSEVYGAALTFYELLPQEHTQMTPMLAQQQQQQQSNSNVTSSDSDGVVGVHSPLSVATAPPSEKLQPAYCPRCLCLLSHYPFYEIFKTFLNQLYRIAVSPSNMPIERFIGHFFNEVPVPRLYIPNVNYTLGHAKVSLTLPPPIGLPYKNFSLLTLFRCLSVENIVKVYEHVLGEGKIVFYSNSHERLTPCAEAIRLLLFPMKWQCVFIPILPTNLGYTVRAPVPFIIGLHRSFLDELKIPNDVFLVDLDRNRLRLPNNIIIHDTSNNNGTGSSSSTGIGSSLSNSNDPSSHHLHVSDSHPHSSNDTKLIYPMPEYMKDFMNVELTDITTSPLDGRTLLYQDQDLSEDDASMFSPPSLETSFPMDQLQVEQQELRIRICFLKITVAFLGQYRRFMLLQAEESESFFDLDRLFDRKGFAYSFRRSCDETLYQFASQLSETQIFSDFILNRVTHTKNFQEMTFFDYCVALVKDGTIVTDTTTTTTTSQQTSNGVNANINTLPSSSSFSSTSSSAHGSAPGASSTTAILPSHSSPITPTSTQTALHHHSKTASEVSKEVIKIEKLKSLLRKKIQASNLYQVTYHALMELMRAGSLTPSTLESIRLLPPSLTPMPHCWSRLSYNVPPPDSSGLPEGRGPYEYDTFPQLDPMKFGDSSQRTNDETMSKHFQQPNSPNASVKWLMLPHPSQVQPIPTTIGGGTGGSGHSTNSHHDTPSKPSHTRGAIGLKKPPTRRSTELEALDAAIAGSEHARSRIIVSLFQHINGLYDKMRTWSGYDHHALTNAQAVYELWFAMFTSSCESERHRKRTMRRQRIREGTYYPVTFLTPSAAASPSPSSNSTPNSGGSTPRSPSSGFDPALAESALRAEEHREALSDLLAMFVELHGMISRCHVLPTERILEDISTFCLRMNLTREFQEVYRLFSTSIPHLSTRFFAQLIRIGITTPLINPEEIGLTEWDQRVKLNSPMTTSGTTTMNRANTNTSHPLQFDSTTTQQQQQQPHSPDETPSYSYPASVCTYGSCSKCRYALSGEEIFGGWLLHPDRLDSACPLCDAHVQPQLIVRHDNGLETRVDFMRPSTIRGTLHSLGMLHGNTLRVGGMMENDRDVDRSSYLTIVRSSPELFWNLFFFFVTRGPRKGSSIGVGGGGGSFGLPIHFLFSEESELLGRVAVNYIPEVGPYQPWRITAENGRGGTDGAGIGSPFYSPLNAAGGGIGGSAQTRDRNISWDIHDPRTASNSIDSTPPKSFTRKSVASDGIPAYQSPAASSAATAALLSGLLDGADRDPAHRVKFEEADEEEQKGERFVLEHLNTSNTTATTNTTAAATASVTANATAKARLSTSPGLIHDPSPEFGGASDSVESRRRSSLSFTNVQYIMLNVKDRPTIQALRRILRARRERRNWSEEERQGDEAFFQASAYQTLAQLSLQQQQQQQQQQHPHDGNLTVDTNVFYNDYKQALASLDSTIEVHKKTLETLDAATNSTHHSNTSNAIDSETSQALELRKKKKDATMLALEESVAMKAELLPCDGLPTQANVNILATVRKLFGIDLHRALSRVAPSSARGSICLPSTVGGGVSGILDDLLASDVPSLEDVLTQVSQNPHYTLEGLMHFCAAFRTQYEMNLAQHTSSNGGGVNDITRSTSHSLSIPNQPSSSIGVSTPTVASSTALSYVRFWIAVRRWRVRYERNDRHRSLSIVVKSSAGLSDGVFESARSIYDRFLLLPSEMEGDNATNTSGISEVTTIRRSSSGGGSSGSSSGERRSSNALTPIAESTPTHANTPIEASAGSPSSTTVTPSTHPTLAIDAPLPQSHFPSAPTPMAQGGHVTTVRGLILPRPLHENIRRTLNEKISIDYVDPLLGSKMASLVHHSVPKHLFDEVAGVVANWLKKHVWQSYIKEVREEEEEEERQEETEKEKEKEKAALKLREETAAAAAAAGVTGGGVSDSSSGPPVVFGPPPPIPPRPAARSTPHSSPKPPVVNRTIERPHVPHATEANETDTANTIATTIATMDLNSPSIVRSPHIHGDASGLTSPLVSPIQIQFHSDSSSTPAPGVSGSPSLPHAFPSASPSPLAPLPLLHNVSGDSMQLAKGAPQPQPQPHTPTTMMNASNNGKHIPDFSSSHSTSNTNA